MDLTKTIAPKSDQLNSDDLVTGPVTVTITEVRDGNAEQPVEIHLAEFPGRPYKPSKSMRRVLVQGWGSDGDTYAGRRLTLFRNPEIKFGGDKVGGIEISHMSHIGRQLSVSLMVTRGKRKPFTVKPLTEPAAPAAPIVPDDVKATTERAVAEGTIDQYIAWLAEQNAPEHIIDYVSERKPA
ncbi:hypothetical protein PP639_gp073 [Arthrobacter phage Seahorse]|uniref:Uncharacterized protein n=1 Tax=Arthrobacter phage Seahorse TaxID=2419611 RepID=A0A3G3M569_9CAUD|nr:hypothetical protein PP639_gp073 [Arthrobacter phage Seahorse]AYR01573.1 hypothetical protein PBI_SEAHORSE_73 [Arthrobacter phage Seahorse]